MSVSTSKLLPYLCVYLLIHHRHPNDFITQAPPSRLAYSSSILSSYNLSAASSASLFCCGAVLVAGWEAFEVGIEESVTGLGSMLEFEGVSLEVKVGMGILIDWLCYLI
jgi:hypothetical protein